MTHTPAALVPRMSWLFAERATIRNAIARWLAPDVQRATARRLLDRAIEADLCRVLLDDIAWHLEALGVSASRIGSVRGSWQRKGRAELQATMVAARELAELRREPEAAPVLTYAELAAMPSAERLAILRQHGAREGAQ